MLREYWLNRLALGCSVAGVLLLFCYSLSVQPKELPVSEIERSKVGSRVSVQGMIEWSHESGSTLLFTVFDGNRVNAVMFNARPEERLAVRKGSFVRVTGLVKEYHGKLELVAERIEPAKESLSIELPGHAND